LEEDAEVIAKVADFGLSQHVLKKQCDINTNMIQVFPFSQQTLHNIMETAPETWEGGNYDEQSDVFSFAIILWRLFGSKAQNETNNQPESESPDTTMPGDDIDKTECAYLKEGGRFFPPPKQRSEIRKVHSYFCILI
jgi:hypothetical protein